jgi:hypothetical protein
MNKENLLNLTRADLDSLTAAQRKDILLAVTPVAGKWSRLLLWLKESLGLPSKPGAPEKPAVNPEPPTEKPAQRDPVLLELLRQRRKSTGWVSSYK